MSLKPKCKVGSHVTKIKAELYCCANLIRLEVGVNMTCPKCKKIYSIDPKVEVWEMEEEKKIY